MALRRISVRSVLSVCSPSSPNDPSVSHHPGRPAARRPSTTSSQRSRLPARAPPRARRPVSPRWLSVDHSLLATPEGTIAHDYDAFATSARRSGRLPVSTRVNPYSEVHGGAPIGIFASRFGCPTVARAVTTICRTNGPLPGDTARSPYGSPAVAAVREYALDCIRPPRRARRRTLIACNSPAPRAAYARERYDVPVFDVILTATRRAVSATRNGRSASSARRLRPVPRLRHAFAPPVGESAHAACHGSSISSSRITLGPEAEGRHEYLEPLVTPASDTLVSYDPYPLLAGATRNFMGPYVTLGSRAAERERVYSLLVRKAWSVPSSARAAHHSSPPPTGRLRVLDAGSSPEVESVEHFSWMVTAERYEMTVIGLCRIVTGPDSPSSCYLVEAAVRGAPTGLSRLGKRGSGRLAASHRPPDSTLSPLAPAADHCSTSPATTSSPYHPGARRAPSLYAPAGPRGPRGRLRPRARPGILDHFAATTGRTARRRARAVPRDVLAGQSVEAYASAPRPATGCSLSGDSVRAIAEQARPGADLFLCERVVDRGQPASSAPHRCPGG